MMNNYDDYVEYDDQQAYNFPQIDILELGENDLKQFFQPLNRIINFNFNKNFQLESSESPSVKDGLRNLLSNISLGQH